MVEMIVLGADTHKMSHTVGAVDAATGRVAADRAVRAKRRSFDDLLRWARALDAQRVWAIEDCRHVSGALERFLLAWRAGRAGGAEADGGRAQVRPGARQVRRDERGRDRARCDPRRGPHAAGRAAGR